MGFCFIEAPRFSASMFRTLVFDDEVGIYKLYKTFAQFTSDNAKLRLNQSRLIGTPFKIANIYGGFLVAFRGFRDVLGTK